MFNFHTLAVPDLTQWWILWWGGVRVEGTENFVWYTTRQPVNGTWLGNEPNGLLTGEDCMMIDLKSNTFMDISCTNNVPLSFVCEFHDQHVTVGNKDEL